MVTKGSTFFVNFGEREGSVQRGVRPAVVVSCEQGNRHSNTVIVAAITKVRKRVDLPVHVRVENTKGIAHCAIILLEQLMTVDKNQIVSYIAKLDESTMKKVNHALKISLELD